MPIIIYGINIPPIADHSAKKALWRHIGGKTLQLTILKQKRQGQLVAIVKLFGNDVAEQLIKSGLATPKENIDSTFNHYRTALQYAQSNHLGIWQQ